LIAEFPTPITYVRTLGGGYDPSTGDVTETTEEYAINAGIEQVEISEEGGVGEIRLIKLYIDHGATGVPHQPSTGDRILYQNRTWKVTEINPEFTSTGLIASYITARAD
jgi:hypothetical protein